MALMQTPAIVLHVLSSGKAEERIIHKGISYSVRAYQLMVVGSSEIQDRITNDPGKSR